MKQNIKAINKDGTKRKESVTWEEKNTPEILTRLAGIIRDGGTIDDIADFMDVSRKTIYEWKHKYADFAALLTENKDFVDRKVENALLKRALGFQYEEKKQIIKNGVIVQEETTVKNALPDVTACVIWLNNRKSDSWKRNKDLYSENNNDIVQVNVVKAKEKSKAINKELKKEKERNAK